MSLIHLCSVAIFSGSTKIATRRDITIFFREFASLLCTALNIVNISAILACYGMVNISYPTLSIAMGLGSTIII